VLGSALGPHFLPDPHRCGTKFGHAARLHTEPIALGKIYKTGLYTVDIQKGDKKVMSKTIHLRVSNGIYEILEEASKTLEKPLSTLAREMMEQRLAEMSLVSSKLKRRR